MYEIYTDGSCLGNPGAGGWGAIGEGMKLCGAMAKTTNNIMEMTAVATPVKNKELWIQIDTLREKVKMIEWRWVKAHNGHPLNEAVDTLARECAKNIQVK